MSDFLKKEDYEEPACVFCKKDEIKRIDSGRVVEKLDEYLNRNDYVSAERHLKYWKQEAELNGDGRGLITVCNELVGLYRKLGRESEALETCEKLVSLIENENLGNSVTAATSYLNIATAYKSFSQAEKAVPLYKKTKEIYERELSETDSRLGGLYNNMGLALTDVGEFEKAKQCFENAIRIMSANEGCEPEQAITYLNMATAAESENGLENSEEFIAQCVAKADKLLETDGLKHDGNYAFVCEKCAPVFGYYGFFLLQKKYSERADRIYEGN
ncbi:MAG: tetratricopeptide repeat protein [Clostridia bacterium]|nr:tetratricopeptide repeat protein [Clostridia bacterium]